MKENSEKTPAGKQQSAEYKLNINFVSMTRKRYFARSISRKPREYHAFIFIEQGTASVTINRRHFSVMKNDILLIPSGSTALILSCSDDFETHLCNFNAELNGDSVFRHYSPPYHCSINDVPSVKSHLIQIEKHLTSGEVIDILKAESHLMRMITEFLEAVPIINKYSSTDPTDFKKRIAMYTENRLSSGLTVGAMADEMGYHPKYFTALFKKHMGMTPSKYIKTAQLNKAKDLLINTTMSISDIAKMAGFSTQPKFANDFKRYVGMTASEYRASQRIKN